MRRFFSLVSAFIVCGLLAAPVSQAQRGRGNGTHGSNSQRTEQRASSRPGNSGHASSRPGNNGAAHNKPANGNHHNNNNSFRPSNNGGNHNNKPNNSGVRPGNNGSHNNGNAFRPGNGNNRPNNGNVRPGNGNHRPGNGNVRPGNGNHGGNHDFNRPGYTPRPDHGPSYRPGHGPAHNHRPSFSHRPPSRPYMPAYRPWAPPVRPSHWRPYPGAPRFRTILGVTFGTTLNVGLNFLINAGYNIASYGNDVIYLNNVPLMNLTWPYATLNYQNGALRGSEFTYSSPGYDRSRYDLLYNSLMNQYGYPVSVNNNGNSISCTWWGYDNGYVTLSYFPDYASNGMLRYYTTLSVGN